MTFPERRLHHQHRNPCQRIVQPVACIQKSRTDHAYTFDLHQYLADVGIQLLSADTGGLNELEEKQGQRQHSQHEPESDFQPVSLTSRRSKQNTVPDVPGALQQIVNAHNPACRRKIDHVKSSQYAEVALQTFESEGNEQHQERQSEFDQKSIEKRELRYEHHHYIQCANQRGERQPPPGNLMFDQPGGQP
ncbi:hypothetical protein D3C73_1016790 [compost metagenome]